MVPKLHAKGCSFKGIAQYVLHDKGRATTAERVVFTEVRNLASNDPEVAWKTMAATAMSADRLKAEAGIRNTGRKSKDAVLHLTLSWHPEEKDGLIQEEMLRAADGAIAALGASDRQALIVAHSDTQPHVHIVINRVSPADGRMLTSSKEKLRLSRFAQKYEQDRGNVYCEERVLNNAARDRGEYTRGSKDTPRHIYELHAANQNRPDLALRHREQRDKDRNVGREQRKIRDRQAEEWAKLLAVHKNRRRAIREQWARDLTNTRRQVAERFRPVRRKLHFEQRAERREFEANEASFLGRMRNRSLLIDTRSLIGRGKGRTISDVFATLASAGARRRQLRERHAQQEARIDSKVRSEQRTAVRVVGRKARTKLIEADVAFERQRADIVLRHAMESAKIRAQWRERGQDRRKDLESERAPGPSTKSASDVFRELMNRQEQDRGRDRRDDHER